jgi:hypothetical protein
LKPDDKESVEAIAEQILKATKLKEKAYNDQEKLLAAAKLDEAKALQKNVSQVTDDSLAASSITHSKHLSLKSIFLLYRFLSLFPGSKAEVRRKAQVQDSTDGERHRVAHPEVGGRHQ